MLVKGQVGLFPVGSLSHRDLMTLVVTAAPVEPVSIIQHLSHCPLATLNIADWLSGAQHTTLTQKSDGISLIIAIGEKELVTHF